MEKRDRKEFARIMAILGESFGEKVSDPRVEAYWVALSDISLDSVKASASRHVKESKFFPKPVELRPCGVDVKARSLIALNTYLLDHHPGETKIFEDRIIHGVVMAMGGARALSEKIRAFDDFGYEQLKREFRCLYESFLGRSLSSMPDRLIGEYEQNNSDRFLDFMPTPRLVECSYIDQGERLASQASHMALLQPRTQKSESVLS